jgi:ankyrin repeat protein
MTLFDAIENGDLRTLRKLMRSGIDLEQVDEASGAAPLALAAEGGRLDAVRILLRSGVDPDWGGATTPLEAAVVEGRLQVAAALIEAGADVNRPVADGFTPLITAASTGHLDLVRLLLEAGANPGVLADEGESALSLAKKKGHREVVEALERAAGNGYRPGWPRNLFAVLEGRDVETLKKLLDGDDGGDGGPPDLLATDRDGLTPLAVAAGLGHVTLVRTLIAAGAGVDDGGSRTPLFCAAGSRHAPVLQALIEAGAAVDAASGEEALTPLMAAAARGNVEAVRLLLEAGADVKALDAGGHDALWHAAHACQEQTFTQLLPHVKVDDRKAAMSELAAHVEARRRLATGAAELVDRIHAGDFAGAKQWLASDAMDPDGFDEEGRTALMLAARHGRRDLLRMLIAAGASFELRDDVEGFTALIHALHGEDSEAHLTVSLLAAAAADPNRASADGRSPLMHAIDRFLRLDEEEVRTFRALAEPLLHTGADVEAVDAEGRTAWQRVEDRLMQEDLPPLERRKLSRVRRVLEENGARASHSGQLDLMTAVAEGQTGRLEELLAETDPAELAALPLLSVAAAYDHWDIVSHLVGAGFDVNTPNQKGDTILVQAAAKGILPIVEQLVAIGADPALKNHDGDTAAKLAAAAGHGEVADFLKKLPKKAAADDA